MSAGERKIAAVLAIVLVVLIGVYVVQQRKPVTPPTVKDAKAGSAQAASGGGCGASDPNAPSAPTQEFGKKAAKVQIVAALPITHGCHVQTEAELKKAYKAHSQDVHLVIYDLFGKDGQAYVKKNGGTRALVLIDGKSKFKRSGKTVLLERAEDGTYKPGDIGPIVADCVKEKADKPASEKRL